MTSVSIALDARDQLGEGPFWDERRGELLRVDIANGIVHGWDPATGESWRRDYDGEVSAVVPRSEADGWVLAIGHRLVLDDGAELRVLATVEEDLPSNRFNDCRCDPQGRLWAGTMAKPDAAGRRATGAAALYRLDGDARLDRVVASTTISNGLGWSPAGDLMYFIDSPSQRVDVFDFDGASGAVANRRAFAEVDPADGLPDGMAVDAEGGVWVCLFGGAALRRYDPAGTLDAVLELPVTNPTSAAFGGPGLRTLFVTSARHRLSEQQLAAEPQAGALLALEPGVAGRPGNRFGS